ncbi:hypothetical protein ABM041_08665 [Morganella morganii]|uniref:hypothetical protein n=1 Tax=Morganella morganii TaxID=582 RepID=UPI003EBAA66F
MNTPANKSYFLKFVDDFDKLGVVSKRTAENIKAAVDAVSSLIPDDELATEWDVDNIVETLKESSGLKDDTVKTYRSRFKSAVARFIDHTEGKELKPVSRRKSPSKAQNKVEDEVKIFSLPIPLRENLILEIVNLPRDLTEEEADRIATIIKSFAIKQ